MSEFVSGAFGSAVLPQASSGHSRVAHLIALCLSILFAAYHLGDILNGYTPASLDLPSIAYLTEIMAGYLAEGRTSGYEISWNAGFPVFVLYPRLSYVLLALPVALFGIEAQLSVNIFVFALAALLPYSFFFIFSRFFPDRSAWWALLFAFFYCSLPLHLGIIGNGYHGLFTTGLVANFMALPLLLWIVAELQNENEDVPIRLLTLLSALVLALHAYHALFLGWTLLFFFLARSNQRLKIVLIGALAALVNLPWLIPFVQNFEFASVGFRDVRIEAIFSVWPLVLEPSRWSSFTSLASSLPEALRWMAPIRSENYFLAVPWVAFIFAAFSLRGIIHISKTRRTLLLFFFFSWIIFSGTLLHSSFGLNIVSDRFHQVLLMLNMIFAGVGAAIFFEETSLPKNALRGVVLCVTFLYCAFDFSLTIRRDGTQHAMQSFSDLSAERARLTRGIEDVLDFLRSENVEGRVTPELSFRNVYEGASSHLLSIELAKNEYEILGGFLTESSFSSRYFNALLAKLSDRKTWGNLEVLDNEEFQEFEPEQLLRRLEHFGSKWLIIRSRKAKHALEKLQVEERHTFGEFELLKLNPKPLAEVSIGEPWFFESRGGMSFHELSNELFLDEQLYDKSILTIPGASFADLPETDRANFSGRILSMAPAARLNKVQLSELCQSKVPVLITGALQASTDCGAELTWLPMLKSAAELRPLLRKKLQSSTIGQSKSLQLIQRDAERIRFQADASAALLLRQSYAKGWKRKDSEQAVFLAAPSFMMTFTGGQTPIELEYLP